MSDADAVADAIADGGDGTQAGEGGESTWMYADGIAGSGDVPEWFKGDKYSTIADQAKAYKDLESRFGSFTGAPEEYKVELADEYTEQGIEITSDDPLYEEAVKFAKESNMSQDGFGRMMNLYAMAKVAEAKAMEEYKTDEIKSLGNDGEKRLQNLDLWAQKNLPEDLYEGFLSTVTTANAVKAIEKIISLTRSAPASADQGQPASGAITHEELIAMQTAVDERGNRKMQNPEYRKEFQKKANEFWGSEEYRKMVG